MLGSLLDVAPSNINEWGVFRCRNIVGLMHLKNFLPRQEQRHESGFNIVEILWKMDHDVKSIFMYINQIQVLDGRIQHRRTQL